MNLYKGFFVVLLFCSALFLSAADGYSYPEYCPGGTASCVDCHGVDYCAKCPSDPTCSVSQTYYITAGVSGGGGSISPSGTVSVPGGNSQQFSITPFAGYQINSVTVDGSSVGPLSVYAFTNVIANHSISATFFQPVGNPPTADFSSTPLTSTDPYIVNFTDQSTDGPTSWLWDFGDGITSTEQNPYHAYLSPGTYTVTLEVANRGGVDILSQNLNASFAACPNDPVDLNGSRQTSIQSAYNNAVEGEVIKIQARDFSENLVLNAPITVTLSGGHDCNYSMNPAVTRITSGSITVRSGTLIIENLVIESSPSATPDGPTLYADNCADCHGTLVNSEKIPTTTTAVQAAIDGNTGNMGILGFLYPDEVQAIVDALNAQTPPTQGCTSCHGQPPSGSSSPNTAGAHAVHTSLGLGSTSPSCAACHDGATHLNGTADIGFLPGFDAQSEPAYFNSNSTCSSTRCHGGRTTPSWLTGSINVNSQCASCHTRRTSGDSYPDQYNDYYSGEHRRHVVSEGYACTVCHNTSVLQSGHFTNLETSIFEQDPADTIGGGSTRVGSYNGSTCSSIDCHGSENW